MKHVINFSGGLCSFWAAHRVIQKHGAKDTILLFADVLIEDAELYEFNRQASELLGVPITRVSREMTPWELFRKEGLIGNNRFPICSVRLKREPLDEFHKLNFLNQWEEKQDYIFNERQPATIYLGFDWNEQHRLNDIRIEKPQWRWDAPMLWEPIWDKCKMETEAAKLGLIIPKAYKQGFPHNNCGRRCVRAGISHWVHLFHVDRAAFTEWELEETATIAELESRGIAWMTMLKDRRGGETNNLSLTQLRTRIEAGDDLPKFEWGGCGCGGATTGS